MIFLLYLIGRVAFAAGYATDRPSARNGADRRAAHFRDRPRRLAHSRGTLTNGQP